MKMNIRGSKVKITPAINDYIENKIGKLDKYLEDPSNVTANVVVKVKGKDQTVEVTIPMKKLILRAEDTHNDLYAAIDLVSEKLERQIRKNKTRSRRERRIARIVKSRSRYRTDEHDSTGNAGTFEKIRRSKIVSPTKWTV